jgi:serine/threonine protein kinase
MAHIGHHLNIIQLIGSCTSQLVSHGIAFVFSEYCEKGDLKNWLNKNASRGRYSQISDPKTSLIHEHKKRFRQSVNDVIEFSKSEKTIEEPKFNDSDLVFFCYQIAKGICSFIIITHNF